LTWPDLAPDEPVTGLDLATNHPDNVFAEGDGLFITVSNSSPYDLYVEIIGTSVMGETVVLAPSGTVVPAGRSHRIPRDGKPPLLVRKQRGRERITAFASGSAMPPGVLLQSPDRRVADRFFHPSLPSGGVGRGTAVPLRWIKKTIEIETR
jgi:hypothetical protein